MSKRKRIENEIFSDDTTNESPVAELAEAADLETGAARDDLASSPVSPEAFEEVDTANVPVSSPVSAVDSMIKSEIATRARKPRKPRSDAGRPRSTNKGRREDEATDKVELEKQEIDALAETVSVMGVTVFSGLADAYADKQKDDKWRFTAEDRANFATAIRFVAKKNASLIAENPELYLFGVAILGYITPRFAIPPNESRVVAESNLVG